MRELGITPITPGVAGFVRRGIPNLFPDGKLHEGPCRCQGEQQKINVRAGQVSFWDIVFEPFGGDRDLGTIVLPSQ